MNLQTSVLLMEEIGELSRHIARKYGEQTIKRNVIVKNIEEEMGDVFLFYFAYVIK